MALAAQLVDHTLNVDVVAVRQRSQVTGRGNPTLQSPHARRGGQDGGALLQRHVRDLDVSARREDHEPRLRRAAQGAPQAGEALGQRRVHVTGRPQVPGSCTQRAGADEDGVGACAQQRHQEAVARVLGAQQRACGRRVAQRRHPVDRRHEVRVHDRVGEADAAVDPLQVERKQVAGQALSLVEDFERVEERLSQWELFVFPTACRNSVRSCGSDS